MAPDTRQEALDDILVAMLPFLHNIFSAIQTLTVNKHARSQKKNSIRYRTNEAFPARKTNLVDFDKLEEYDPKWPKVVAPEW